MFLYFQISHFLVNSDGTKSNENSLFILVIIKETLIAILLIRMDHINFDKPIILNVLYICAHSFKR